MKIVNIIGGLGNQMFQYAFALSLKDKLPDEEVLIDTSHFHTIFFHHYKGMNLHQGYELESTFLNLSLQKAKWYQLAKVTWYIPNYLLSRIARKFLPKRKKEYIQLEKDTYEFIPEVYGINCDCYYEGYWQSVKFSEVALEKLKHEFDHPIPNTYNNEMIDLIQLCNSVGIHIRRGDYVTNKGFGGICDLDYYKRAIEKVGTDGKEFFIFSNDINWCRGNILPLLNGATVHFVTENKGKNSHWDMFLMSYCKSLIIANSSFSWWGAVLNRNENAVIVAPQKWNKYFDTVDVHLDNWIKI